MPPKKLTAPPKAGGSKARDERNELFAGAGGTGGKAPEPTVNELVQQAVTTHKDTTDTARRALKIVEDTKKVQAETLAALEEQGRTIDRIDDNITSMNAELSYAEKLLTYMKFCCLCQVFDCCTGVDPEDRKKEIKAQGAAAARKAAAAEAAKSGGGSASNGTAGKGGKGGPPGKKGAQHLDPHINLGKEFAAEEDVLRGETAKQNDYIDQIGDGLGHLLQGANAMNDELDKQNTKLDAVTGKAENTNSRIKNMNNKSALAEFK